MGGTCAKVYGWSPKKTRFTIALIESPNGTRHPYFAGKPASRINGNYGGTTSVEVSFEAPNKKLKTRR
jgi:hypothetical protein